MDRKLVSAKDNLVFWGVVPKAALFLFVFFVASICFLSLSAGQVLADGIEIDYVEVIIDGDTVLRTGGSSATLDISPGDDLQILVRLENTFDDDSDEDLDDVEVEAVLFGIDDGDDIDDDAETDVRAGRGRTVTLDLHIPGDASPYETYDLVVSADAGSSQDSVYVEIDVERQLSELLFESVSVSSVDCSGRAYFYADVENAGEEEELDARLTVSGSRMGIVFSDTFDVPGVGSDGSNFYSFAESIYVGDVPAGEYVLHVELEYDRDNSVVDEYVRIFVPDCASVPLDDSAEGDIMNSEERWERDYAVLQSERDQLQVYTYGGLGVTSPSPISAASVYADSNSGEGAGSDGGDELGVAALVLANFVLIILVLLLVRYVYIEYYG